MKIGELRNYLNSLDEKYMQNEVFLGDVFDGITGANRNLNLTVMGLSERKNLFLKAKNLEFSNEFLAVIKEG